MSRLFSMALISAPFIAGLLASGVAAAANDLSLESIDSRRLTEVVQEQEQVQNRDLLQERSRVGGGDAAGSMQQQRERQQQQTRTQTKIKTQSQTPAGGSGGRGYSGAGGSGRGTGGGGRR